MTAMYGQGGGAASAVTRHAGGRMSRSQMDVARVARGGMLAEGGGGGGGPNIE